MDLNGDGHGDLLSGSYSRMSQPMAGLFQVFWGRSDGIFRNAATLTGMDGEPLIIPVADEMSWVENICTRPTAVDWDADGDLDLVVGNSPGRFYLFTGEGNGRFRPKPQAIMSGDGPLMVNGRHGDPFPVDWDDDGDIDLLSGSSSGGVQWAENVASVGEMPQLKPFQTLIAPATQTGYGQLHTQDDLRGPTGPTRIWVDDVNSDGKLDILVGDTVTLISPSEGLSKAEFNREYANWQEAVEVAFAEARSDSADASHRNEARQRVRVLLSESSEFSVAARTGFVWLFLRK